MSSNKVIEIQTIDFSVPENSSSNIVSSNVNDRLTILESNLKTLKSEIDNKSEHNESFNSKFTFIEKDLVTLKNEIDSNLKNNNSKINNKFFNFQSTINELQEQIENINLNNVSNIEDSEIKPKIIELDDKVNKLSEKVDNVDVVSSTIQATIEKGMKIKIPDSNLDKEKVTKNMLELDMGIKNNSLAIQNLQKNISNINSVEDVINDLIDKKLNLLTPKINELSNNLNNLKTLVDNHSSSISILDTRITEINSIVKNLQNNDKISEDTKKPDAEEQVEEEQVEEEQVVEEQVEEEQVEEEQVEEEQVVEEQVVEEQVEEEQVEEERVEEDKEKLQKLIEGEIELYPTSGYTFYGFYEGGTFDLTIGIFIKKNNEYELRGKQTDFKVISNKIFLSVNIQLEKDETDFIICRYQHGLLEIYNEMSSLNISELKIGENNLVSNLDDLPIIKFN